MSDDVLKGQWKQIRGQAKDWWGRLTDDDLDRIDGKFDRLVGVVQERYGLAKERAEADIMRHIDNLRAAIEPAPNNASQPRRSDDSKHSTSSRG